MSKTYGSGHSQVTAILCDMDNTLFDLVGAKREACRCVVEYLGAGDPEELFERFLSGVYGFEHHDNIRDFLEALGVYHPHIFERCCSIYESVKLELVEPYPGVEETLRRMQKAEKGLAVVTDAVSFQAERRLRKTGLIDFFEIVVTPEISGKRKPEPESLFVALRHLDAIPERSLMVGDSIVRDIAPGRKIGMRTAFAAYGDWRSGSPADTEADIVLQHFAELLLHIDLEGRSSR
jgi:putative hydrolase of the HAD superfamily